jgi:hypothetical protein
MCVLFTPCRFWFSSLRGLLFGCCSGSAQSCTTDRLFSCLILGPLLSPDAGEALVAAARSSASLCSHPHCKDTIILGFANMVRESIASTLEAEILRVFHTWLVSVVCVFPPLPLSFSKAYFYSSPTTLPLPLPPAETLLENHISLRPRLSNPCQFRWAPSALSHSSPKIGIHPPFQSFPNVAVDLGVHSRRDTGNLLSTGS